MRLVEAAHAGDGDWQQWCDGLSDAARRLFTSPHVNLVIARRERGRYVLIGHGSSNPALVEHVGNLLRQEDPRVFDAFWRDPGYVGTTAAILRNEPVDPGLARFHQIMGTSDICGLVGLANDVSLSLGAAHSEPIRISPGDRRLLTQVALHLESGLRLRVEPSAVVAWIDTSGKVVHAEGEARDKPIRTKLSTHVKAVEQSRTRRHRQSAEAVDAWQALVSGRWALVERGQNRTDRMYAVVAAGRASRLRAWSELETHAVELSARGLTGKAAAYALGVSPASVSKLLSSAAGKLGVGSRTELVRLTANLLGVGPHGGESAITLTPSERDVLGLLRLGWTNAAIARERGRSEHTVANQVVSLLKKLRVPSRRALATLNVDV